MIPYGKQNISEEDIAAVVDVLRSDFLTQGAKVPEFEEAFASKVGAKFGVATNSATSALHLACLALNIAENDLVWTSPISFVASANCARYCGAEIDFVDVDPVSANIDVARLAEKLEQAKSASRLPKVLIVVHLCGNPCQMSEIRQLTDSYGVKVIEDASHAVGARYKSEYVGSCQYSDITIFSFHPVKIITTAEGGMAFTNDPSLAKTMSLLRSHGVTRDQELMNQSSEGSWYYQQLALGYNYRMTELQAALGISQLDRLDSFVEKRNRLAESYNRAFNDLPLILPVVENCAYSSYHLYVIQLQEGLVNVCRKELFDTLRAKGVGVNVHYIPIHTQPYYQELGFRTGDYPAAEKYYRNAISLPLHPALTDEEQAYIISIIRSACE